MMRSIVLRHSTLLAWLLAGLTLLLLFGSLIFALLSRSAAIPVDLAGQARIVWLLGFAAAPIVGALIATRQPNNPYGWLWLVFSLAFGGVSEFAEGYIIYARYVAPDQMPLTGLMILLATYGFLLGMALIPFILLLFPTGRLLSKRWRIVAWVTAIGGLMSLITAWAVPGENPVVLVENPFSPGGIIGDIAFILFDVGVLLLFSMFILSAMSLLIRFRRSEGAERQQIKWFAFAAAIWVIAQIQQLFWEFPGIWDSVEEAITLALLPISVGVAILRYRLYDIDIIIRRTLVYALLTAILALVYFGSVVALQRVFIAFTGDQSAVVVVLSTLLIAALFNPLRGRVQGTIDRRFYRLKYDAEHTLATFAATARNEVELDALAAELLRVVEDTMQPEHISLWLKKTTDR
jgi:hypothetical protein